MSKHSTLKVSEHHLMSSLIKLFDCHLSRLIEGSELKGQSEHELNPLFEGINRIIMEQSCKGTKKVLRSIITFEIYFKIN